jgi:hypothetical protein
LKDEAWYLRAQQRFAITASAKVETQSPQDQIDG